MTLCKGLNCDREAKTVGLCRKHYYRWLRHRDIERVDTPPGLPANTEGCSVQGCSKPHSVHGYCRAHARRLRVYGDPTFAPAKRKPRAIRPLAERFWEKVAIGGPDECWPWKGPLNKDGYGKFKINGKSASAHRVAWELTNGPLEKGRSACHSCDSRYPVGDTTYRRCANPAHSFPGTQAENVKDMHQKGRIVRPKGVTNPAAKLTESDVLAIRAQATAGVTNRALAAAYGVTPAMIGQIVRGTAWRHI